MWADGSCCCGTAFSRQIDLAILLSGPRGISRTTKGRSMPSRLAAARVAPERHSDQPCARSFATPTASHLRRDLSLARDYIDRECEGDYRACRWREIFLSEARVCGIGTYAPHDPRPPISRTCRVGRSVQGCHVGDGGSTRLVVVRRGLCSSRGVLEMIEILKVKREFLYLL